MMMGRCMAIVSKIFEGITVSNSSRAFKCTRHASENAEQRGHFLVRLPAGEDHRIAHAGPTGLLFEAGPRGAVPHQKKTDIIAPCCFSI